MSSPAPGIPETDLHAYVDGQLSPERQAELARLLPADPAAAERVAAYAAQRDALRAAFAGINAEPVPPRLDLQVLIARRLAERRTYWRAAAAVILAFLLGGTGGWVLHAGFGGGPSSLTVLAQDAIANHRVYAADRKRPTELDAEQRGDLARWVSNRLGRPVAPPDMSVTGFRYIGGRLAATRQGPAGLFMYQNAEGARLTVFVLPMRDASDRSMHDVDVGALDGCAWIDKGVGYTVVAAVPPEELHRLAVHARKQLDGGATPTAG